MYTKESLEVLTISSLVTLAEYNGVPNVKKYMRKGDIIDKIIEHMKPVIVEEEPPMSVRVRRIKEQNRS